MPLKKSGAMRVAGLTAAVCGALALTPVAATATTSPQECPREVTKKTFAFLGDLNDYFLAPGGDFEGPLQWAPTGDVQHKPVNVSFLGDKAVGLGAGAAIESPGICVDVTRPHIRFAVHPPSSGTLRVDAVDGTGAVTTLGSIDAAVQRLQRSSSGWSATPFVPLSTVLGITTGTRTVKLRITAAGGAWDVDEINVDPYRR